MTLSEFVTARLDEDERIARGLRGATVMAGRRPDFYGCGGPAAEDYWKRFDAERALRDIELHRLTLARNRTAADWGPGNWPRELLLLAALWSDHPDYEPAWAPEDSFPFTPIPEGGDPGKPAPEPPDSGEGTQ